MFAENVTVGAQNGQTIGTAAALLSAWETYAMLMLGGLLLRTLAVNFASVTRGNSKQQREAAVLSILAVVGLGGVYVSLFVWLGAKAAAGGVSTARLLLTGNPFVEGYREVSGSAESFFFSSVVLTYAPLWTVFLADTTRHRSLHEVYGLWLLGIFGAISAAAPSHILILGVALPPPQPSSGVSAAVAPLLWALLAVSVGAAFAMRATHSSRERFDASLVAIHAPLAVVPLVVRSLPAGARVPRSVYRLLGVACVVAQLSAFAGAAAVAAAPGKSWGGVLHRGGWANLPTRGMLIDWICVAVANGMAISNTASLRGAAKWGAAAVGMVNPGAALTFALTA